MTKRQSGRTRNEYIQLIGEYTRRANKYPKGSPIRKKLILKIHRFKRMIKTIKERGFVYTNINGKFKEIPKGIHDAAEKIQAYFGENVRASLLSQKGPYRMPQRVFCKYALELGYKSAHVSFFIGAKKPYAAGEVRKRLTNSFKHNAENKRIYYSFLASTKEES